MTLVFESGTETRTLIFTTIQGFRFWNGTLQHPKTPIIYLPSVTTISWSGLQYIVLFICIPYLVLGQGVQQEREVTQMAQTVPAHYMLSSLDDYKGQNERL